MTASDHNKIIGYLFLIFGGCTALLLVPIFLQIVAALNAAERAASGSTENVQNSQNAIALLFVLIVILGATFLIGAAIEITAGFAMLKQKSWAYSAAILAGVVALINFPIGTALGLYALWFLLGAAGKRFYVEQARVAAGSKN